MEDICIQCKQLATVSCSCDRLLRFCSNCYLFLHKKTQGDHNPMNPEKMSKEIYQKIHFTEETKLESFKFSKH